MQELIKLQAKKAFISTTHGSISDGEEFTSTPALAEHYCQHGFAELTDPKQKAGFTKASAEKEKQDAARLKAEQHAAAIIAEAKEEAAGIIRAAKKEAEAVRNGTDPKKAKKEAEAAAKKAAEEKKEVDEVDEKKTAVAGEATAATVTGKPSAGAAGKKKAGS